MNLFYVIGRMLTYRRRQREEQQARARAVITRARIESIRTRSRELSLQGEEHRRRFTEPIVFPTFDTGIPVAVLGRVVEPETETFKGGGGQSGGAGASASWEPAVADQCSPSCDAPATSND